MGTYIEVCIHLHFSKWKLTSRAIFSEEDPPSKSISCSWQYLEAASGPNGPIPLCSADCVEAMQGSGAVEMQGRVLSSRQNCARKHQTVIRMKCARFEFKTNEARNLHGKNENTGLGVGDADTAGSLKKVIRIECAQFKLNVKEARTMARITAARFKAPGRTNLARPNKQRQRKYGISSRVWVGVPAWRDRESCSWCRRH